MKSNKLFKNKRGSGIADPIVVIVFILVMFFCSLFSLFIFTKFNDQWQAAEGVDATSKAAVQEYSDNWTGIADTGIMVWFAILWLGTLVTSFFLFNHPIFYVVFILLSIFSFFALVPFSNIVAEMCANAELIGTCAYFPLTTYFIDKIALIITLFIFSVGLTLYAKVKTQ